MEKTCCVCGKPLEEAKTATCYVCGGDFHMDFTGPPDNDCGNLVPMAGRCGLAYACGPCFNKTQPSLFH